MNRVFLLRKYPNRFPKCKLFDHVRLVCHFMRYKQLTLSEECLREFSFLVNKSSRQQQQQTAHPTKAVIAPSDETQQRIAPATHHTGTSPSQQAGRACLVLCVVYELTRCSENADSSSRESAVLCCRIGFLAERSPHAVHDYGGSYGPPRLNTISIVFLLLMLPPHPADKACVVCVMFQPSWWFFIENRKTSAVSTTDGWLKLNFASCVIRQTRSLGALVLYSIYNMVCVN